MTQTNPTVSILSQESRAEDEGLGEGCRYKARHELASRSWTGLSSPNDSKCKTKIYDELNDSWTKSENNFEDEKDEKAKGLGQLTKEKKGKDNEA